MNTILNCFKAIINAWYGQKEETNDIPSEENEESFTEAVTNADTLVMEKSKEELAKNNIIITEMLASLSILEEAEASVFEKHPINQSYHAKMFAGLSEIIELDTKDEQDDNEPQETSIPERKPRPELDSNLPDIDNKRANVITEIINSERDYVKNLRDIYEGYYMQCQKTKDLFPHARLVILFANIGDIYKMHKRLLASMEKNYKLKEPHLSEFGACFIEQKKGFMMYAEYCRNHINALEEWTKLIMVEKYAYFFEVCRMHQQMINLPLDGFLIMPVQRICKYPLLLKELHKSTLPFHPDYANVEEAVISMRKTLDAINAESGEEEHETKLLKFQNSLINWKGDDLTELSTQLVHRGDLILISERGTRAKNFVASLFDHQMILCKKDLIRRNTLYYKERINLDNYTVIDEVDGIDMEFDCKIKNAFKLRSKLEDQCKLFFAKSLEDKQLWLRAFEEERRIAEGSKFGEDSYYDFPALNISTVTKQQLSFLSLPTRRKSSLLRNFRNKIFAQ
ncbi:rho guanine nucleotide exchange factor 9-like isoform X2 [Narcine bancroftii]|uniref:rho guanine nucleotide exchange factor 9-like isoform X2 n=1 Tax=Narcine bancroftii TaxID=1343680 RepID=UPI00383228B0